MPREESVRPWPKPVYAWYVVAVLMLAYMSSFIDRMIVNLLVDPIRRDMGISDTQMSLLMGLSFALFYTLFGLPIGRMADSMNRSRIITVGILVWSAMTVACGMVKNYAQFLLARMGVGVGEAALSPAAYSMLTDYFPKERLATAMSVYSLGIYLGSGLALLVAAVSIHLASVQDLWHLPLVGAIFPWQMVFFIVGIPGLLIALLMLTVREPARRDSAGASSVPLREVFAHLKANRSAFICHNFGFALLALVGYAAAAWVPTSLIRVYGMNVVEAAVAYGLAITVFGTLGAVGGGWLADRLAANGRADGRMRVGLMAAVGMLPFTAAFPFMPAATAATVLLVPICFFASLPFGAASAALQEMTPPRMRAQASALYLLVINLIGLGIGPTAVALFTDFVFRDDLAVARSLGLVCVLALCAAAAVVRISFKPFRESLARLERWAPAAAAAAAK